MKRNIISVFVFSVIVILAISCKKSSSSNTSNSINGNFTLKYEIITSSSVIAYTDGSHITLVYENGTQQPETDLSFTSGTVWSKEFTVTSSIRPFQAILMSSSGYPGIRIASPGTVTCNIYVNGTQVAHSVNQTNTVGSNNYGPISAAYVIQ